MWQMLLDFLWAIIQYLLDFITYIPVKIWNFFVDQVLIPVVTWVYSLVPTDTIDLSAIPSGVAYFLNVLQVRMGLVMVLGAYMIRFMIRRIPIIG